MARDAAELKEVLQSVSTMLKPFYAQVILSALQPLFNEYRGHHAMQHMKQDAGGRTGRAQQRICCRPRSAVGAVIALQNSVHIPHLEMSMPPSVLHNCGNCMAPADLLWGSD